MSALEGDLLTDGVLPRNTRTVVRSRDPFKHAHMSSVLDRGNHNVLVLGFDLFHDLLAMGNVKNTTRNPSPVYAQ